MSEEKKKRKTCTECGAQFRPMIDGQERCLSCIMAREPILTDGDHKDAPDFAEWFIYHWRHIQAVAKAIKDRKKDA